MSGGQAVACKRPAKWLRRLIVVVVLLAIIVGAELCRRSADVETAVEAAGGQVMWGNRPNVAQELMARMLGMSDGSAVSLGLGDTNIDDDWLRAHRSGMERIADRLALCLTNTRITDVGLAHLRDLANVDTVNVNKTGITDAGLDHLRTLSNLDVLSIDHTRVTDDGMSKLASFPKLLFLVIDNSQTTERGVAHLKNCRTLRYLMLRDATDETVGRLRDFTQLERLSLDGAGVTDASIPILSGMPNLESIIFVDDSLSEAGFESLKQALPKCGMTRLTAEEIEASRSE